MPSTDWPVIIGHNTEKLEKYQEGGFCPIHIGDCIGRFTVLHKLGHGGFGTVWLVRDATNRHGRYVALKVVSAEYSENYEQAAVLERLSKYERDYGRPGVFAIELERFFHTSLNGKHLCLVLPVLGPPLSALNTPSALLFLPLVRSFAQQLASGLAAMHSLGVCHGDFTLKNTAIKLGKSLDHLTEPELGRLFGRPRTESIDYYFPERPSPAPQYVVRAADLTLLPLSYLSTRICIFDFDQAFLTSNAPHEVPFLPPTYLAPESIFTLTNGPAADVWALGCILFNLRYPMQLFLTSFANDPEATARKMYAILGPLPKEFLAVPFLDGWPVHESLEPGVQYKTINPADITSPFDLDYYVGKIRNPCRPTSTGQPRTGLENFCLEVPDFDVRDYEGQAKFESENTTPIGKEDAKLFTDLLRKMFDYDYTKRITARQVLDHPWLQETG